MIRQLSLFGLVLCSLFFTQCLDYPSDTITSGPLEGRNMFGHGIKRGLTIKSEDLDSGYIMFCPPNSASMYLINRDGLVVHEWKSNYAIIGGYLNEDGSLFQNAYDVDFPVFAGGGESGRLQHITWEGKLLWDFEYADEQQHVHHDFAVMPNGHILAIAWESKSAEEVLQAGRKPDMIPAAGIWPEKIVEIVPNGKYHGEVVWEWHIWDHMIQDHDPTKDNYGDPSAHPELMDINLGHPLPPPISQDSMDILHANQEAWRNETVENRGSDVYHFNAINYNADLDQIVFSSQTLSEIYVIDHSTTSQEAASHTGGRSGKGGDFLYRWGNPQNYKRGDSTDQILFHQHDIRWIEDGKNGAGNLTVFCNDIPGGPDSLNYSAVYEFTPPMDNAGAYVLEEGAAFGPEQPTWTYTAEDTLSFYGAFISGAHRMENGNTFITEGPRGRFFEVTPEGQILWEYLNPYRGSITRTNGDIYFPRPMTYICFRSTFIPEDHPALIGKDLQPLQPQPKPFKFEEFEKMMAQQ